MRGKQRWRVSFNSPVVLVFSLICVAAMVLDALTMSASTNLLFSVYRAPLIDPLTWLRFFCHVFGHADWEHLLNNLMYILILGPMIEEKYGSADTGLLIAFTALVTGLVNYIFFPHVRLLGASGVVFAMILLASITRFQEGSIPLTFILVAVLYIGQQIFEAVTVQNNVSHVAHIVGGLTGSGLGIVMNRAHAGTRQSSYK